MPILTKVYCTWWFVFQDPNNNWIFAFCKATLIIYVHLYPFSGGCNGTTSDQGRHKLLQAPVNMGEMAENLGKSSNSIYYNSMVSIYTQEVKLNSAWDACSQMHGGNV